MHTILRVETDVQLQQVLRVRYNVFVLEQQVPADQELDDYEDRSHHFLALDEDGVPCGAARWRITAVGVKLERFAVASTHRGRNIGTDLVRAVLDDIELHPRAARMRRYLHAQSDVVKFYAKLGFRPYGERFDECDIQHQAMELLTT